MPFTHCHIVSGGAWIPSHPCSRLLSWNPDFCHQIPQDLHHLSALSCPHQPMSWSLSCVQRSGSSSDSGLADASPEPNGLAIHNSMSPVQPPIARPSEPPALVTPIPQMLLSSPLSPILRLPWLSMGKQLFLSTLLPKSPAHSLCPFLSLC